MSLLVYNLTAAPLVLANGLSTTIPASTAGAGARGKPWYASGNELNGLTGPQYLALQAQQNAGDVTFEWQAYPEYPTPGLTVGSAQEDASDIDVNLWCDPSIGVDGPGRGSQTAPFLTPEFMHDAMPGIYKRALNLFFNINPTTAALNTAKKTYTLSAQALQFFFPAADGKLAQSARMFGGWTNELGDLTATAGSTTSLTTNQNLTIDQFLGAQIEIISGTGATQNAPRKIRGNTAGPNSVITVETQWTVAPDATSVYRISYPNVEIRFTQRLAYVPPPQTLFQDGIKFVFVGTGTAVDFQVGNANGGFNGGGTLCWPQIEFDGGSGGNRCNLRVRGARLQIDGSNGSYWAGPNNPYKADSGNNGCYIHGLNNLSLNAMGSMLGASGLIKDTTLVQVFSGGAMIVGPGGATLDNSPVNCAGDGIFNIFSLTATARTRIRRCAGTAPAVTYTALGKGVANNGPITLLEFSEITTTGGMVVVSAGAQAILGDISVGAGNTTAIGLDVQTGGKVRVAATTLLAGATTPIRVDGQNMTLAQALAAPFGGTLNSNVVQPYVVADPGNAGAIPVTVDGVCNLTSAGAETRTLAAPTYAGQKLGLAANVLAGNIVVTAVTGFNSSGLTVATFSVAGQALTLMGVLVAGALRWRVIGNDGFPLAVQFGTAQIAANAVDETKLALTLASAPQSLAGPGAISVATRTTLFTSTGAGDALTLANGVRTGQRKTVWHTVAAGTGVITPTTPGNFATVTLAVLYSYAEFEWSGAVWNVVGFGGAAVVA